MLLERVAVAFGFGVLGFSVSAFTEPDTLARLARVRFGFSESADVLAAFARLALGLAAVFARATPVVFAVSSLAGVAFALDACVTFGFVSDSSAAAFVRLVLVVLGFASGSFLAPARDVRAVFGLASVLVDAFATGVRAVLVLTLDTAFFLGREARAVLGLPLADTASLFATAVVLTAGSFVAARAAFGFS